MFVIIYSLRKGAGASLTLKWRFLMMGMAMTASTVAQAASEQVVLDFEEGPLGDWIPAWEEKGVSLNLAWEPRQSKAKGSLTFFTHLATGRKGILCAMAEEQIPVDAHFPRIVSSVTITFWAHTGSSAKVEAFDAEGLLIDTAILPEVPRRQAPGDPMPQFEMTVFGPGIAYVRFSGPRLGEFLAADELRYR